MKQVRLALGLVAAVGVATLLGCDKANLKDDKGQYSYAIGVQVGKNLKSQNITVDYASFNAGLKDAIEDKEMKMKDEDRMAALKKMSETLRADEEKKAEGNVKVGEEFLEKNKAKEGVKVTASGLQYKMITEGAGPKPKASDMVEVHYKGTLIDGTQFDSSYERGTPAQFPVEGVIPGWTEALQLMTVGSKYELTIPSGLAYGPRGNPKIPGNSVLLFEVELLKILPAENDAPVSKAKNKK